MCARFHVIDTEILASFFIDVDDFKIEPRHNVAPSEPILNVGLTNGKFALESHAWGIDSGGRKLVNARSEGGILAQTMGKRPRYQRRIVPATGYFEWRQEGAAKQPYDFSRLDGVPLGLAAVYDPGSGCAIFTTEPNELVAQYHTRMPSILDPKDFRAWLESDDPREIEALARIPFPAENMRARPVSRKVNAPSYKEPFEILAQPDQSALF